MNEVTNWNELQLTTLEKPDLDLDRASSVMRMLPGKIAVEMHECEKKGLIYLPVSNRLRPDVGTVIGVGRGIPLEVGDVVLCRPDDGQWHESFNYGGYEAKGTVRLFGIAGTRPEHVEGQEKDRGVYEIVPWWESVPARVCDDRILPNGPQVVIRRERIQTSLVMTDNRLYSDIATVTSGEYEGARITYKILNSCDLLTFAYGEEDLAIIPISAIQAVIE